MSDFNPGCQTKFETKFLIPELLGPPLTSMSGRARERAQADKAEQEISVCGKSVLWSVPLLHQEKKSNPSDIEGDSQDSLAGDSPPVLADGRYLNYQDSVSAGWLVKSPPCGMQIWLERLLQRRWAASWRISTGQIPISRLPTLIFQLQISQHYWV